MNNRILVAGIGNIFLGDDAFGVEVARRLSRQRLPPDVTVIDFGIRSYDLAYAITGGYGTVILVDTVQRGEAPGTLYLLELDPSEAGEMPREMANAHGLTPAGVLQMVRTFGGTSNDIYFLGCETKRPDLEDGSVGLTREVEAAVPEAIAMIRSLIDEVLAKMLV